MFLQNRGFLNCFSDVFVFWLSPACKLTSIVSVSKRARFSILSASKRNTNQLYSSNTSFSILSRFSLFHIWDHTMINWGIQCANISGEPGFSETRSSLVSREGQSFPKIIKKIFYSLRSYYHYLKKYEKHSQLVLFYNFVSQISWKWRFFDKILKKKRWNTQASGLSWHIIRWKIERGFNLAASPLVVSLQYFPLHFNFCPCLFDLSASTEEWSANTS